MPGERQPVHASGLAPRRVDDGTGGLVRRDESGEAFVEGPEKHASDAEIGDDALKLDLAGAHGESGFLCGGVTRAEGGSEVDGFDNAPVRLVHAADVKDFEENIEKSGLFNGVDFEDHV